MAHRRTCSYEHFDNHGEIKKHKEEKVISF